MRTRFAVLCFTLVAWNARATSPAPANSYEVASKGNACKLEVRADNGSSYEVVYRAVRADGSVAFEKTEQYCTNAIVSDGCHVLLRRPSYEETDKAFVLLGPKGQELAALSLADLLTPDEIAKLGQRAVSHLVVDVDASFDEKAKALVLVAKCGGDNLPPKWAEARRQKCGDTRVERRVELATGKLQKR